MLTPDLTEDASEFLDSLPTKTANQIWKKIAMLCQNPNAGDVKQLVGYPFLRCRCGDYRIIYEIEDQTTLLVVLVGYRGDDEVYKELKRLYG
jgi:mRNA interferase RelE/StbE